MKFTDGYWLKRAGWSVLHPREIQRVELLPDGFRAFAPTRHVLDKGQELDLTILTVTVRAVAEGILKVRLENFRGQMEKEPSFKYTPENLPAYSAQVSQEGDFCASVSAGGLKAEIKGKREYQLSFTYEGKAVTSSILRSEGIAISPEGDYYIHEQLTLAPQETIYGLGERFGAFVKNGQTVEMWNSDGGTATEQAYKNIPFYISSAGYGVLVNHPERVSYEVASEINTRVQFSVPGQSLEYFVIAGPTPKDVLKRYCAFSGPIPSVPQWSYGLWLSTSFKTDYSEEKVHSILDEMEENGIPVSVLHFDCYWMRPSHWCDFIWDPDKFPDPKRMLDNLHKRGVRVCVWINPYIGQQSYLFDEGMEKGYLLKKKDGSIRQWDHWQSGMGWVDFTNPEAVAWWKSKLKVLLEQGVDCFKTDFGERVPTDVQWFNGADPEKMHNYYTLLYNRAVYEAIAEVKGEASAIVFARSGTTGSQSLPVHWGGDSEPTFVSMAETLRGGLSLSMSGFSYWSHDMGGFEGKPDNDVFIRWYPFGIFSSHSRLHGSDSYRTPWLYGDEATATAKRFTSLKNRLLPYIVKCENEAVRAGTPIIRPMVLEFPGDIGSRFIDSQYMFGSDLLVAPVFRADGEVDVYLPSRGWTNVLDGVRIEDAGWHHQKHAYDSLPLLVKDGGAIPLSLESLTSDYVVGDNPILLLVQPSQLKSGNSRFVGWGSENEFQIEIRYRGSSVELIPHGESRLWSVVLIDCNDVLKVENGTVNETHPVNEIRCGRGISPERVNEKVTIRF